MSYEIPKHHRQNFLQYRSYMQPDVTYQRVPWLLDEVIRVDVTGQKLTVQQEKQLLHSQLVYLHGYTRALYDNGQKEGTPPWAFDFTQVPLRELHKAIYEPAAGRRLFRTLEGAMRYSPTSQLGLEVLNVLKPSFTEGTMMNAIGSVAFYIMHVLVRDVALSSEQKQFIRHTAIWCALGENHAYRFVQKYPELTPGVHDEQAQAVKEGYAYLAQMLVLVAGLPKAAVARVLGVSRHSVINWVGEETEADEA